MKKVREKEKSEVIEGRGKRKKTAWNKREKKKRERIYKKRGMGKERKERK